MDSTIAMEDYESPRLRRRHGIENSMKSMVRRIDPNPISVEEKFLQEYFCHKTSLISVRKLALSLPPSFYKTPLKPLIRKKRDNLMISSKPISSSLEDMEFPISILDFLRSDSVDPLTNIQIEALSVAMSGRDMIGISFTGSGIGLLSVLPLVMVGLKEEVFAPISTLEGPFGVILCPSNELAIHMFQLVQIVVDVLNRSGQHEVKPLLCADGNGSDLWFPRRGFHVVVATPQRLNLLLATDKIDLDNCRYLALDKADLLLGRIFEDEVQRVLGRFKGQKQTLIFCANMTAEVQKFARTSMVQPVTLNAPLSGLTENVNAITINNV